VRVPAYPNYGRSLPSEHYSPLAFSDPDHEALVDLEAPKLVLAWALGD
jgi:hypothetical protein